MIQTSELRIGNLVNYKWFDKTAVLIDGYPRQKTIIHREVLSVLAVDGENDRALIKTKQRRKNQTWVSLDKLTPIHLTEEILLKCGFYKIKRSIGLYYKTKNCDIITIYSDGNFKWCDRYINTQVIHLQQLQNLIFALTGEELEIEL